MLAALFHVFAPVGIVVSDGVKSKPAPLRENLLASHRVEAVEAAIFALHFASLIFGRESALIVVSFKNPRQRLIALGADIGI
jgi:hypothetical protein